MEISITFFQPSLNQIPNMSRKSLTMLSLILTLITSQITSTTPNKYAIFCSNGNAGSTILVPVTRQSRNSLIINPLIQIPLTKHVISFFSFKARRIHFFAPGPTTSTAFITVIVTSKNKSMATALASQNPVLARIYLYLP